MPLKSHKVSRLLFFCLATLLLLPGFYRNQWQVIEPDSYSEWQKLWEYNVVARLVKSAQDGFFSAGGFVGIGDVTEWNVDRKVIEHQYEVYEQGGQFKTYWAYGSNPGFEGVVFSLFDRLTNFAPLINIKIFRGAVSFASALTLALFSLWILGEFGWTAAVLTILSIVLSALLTLLGGNIYWNLWAFYLPLLVCTFLLAVSAPKGLYPASKIHAALFFFMLIKILFTGFEFITTAVIMPIVPFVYYAVRDGWGWKPFFKRMLWLGATLFAAVLAGLVILSVQLAVLTGNISGSLNYIVSTFNRRSFGDPQNYSGIYADAMRASVVSVIWDYLNLRAFTLPFLAVPVTYLQLTLFFGVMTILFWVLKYIRPALLANRVGLALVMATWFALSAPLSWYILFKAHSYIHTRLDPSVWQMPFTLFGFALCGFVLSNYVALIFQTGRLPRQ
jgi:hypothetical protein